METMDPATVVGKRKRLTCENTTKRENKMFALVKYNDGLQEIVSMKNIKMQDWKTCIVNYKGCKYQAELLVSNETQEYLEHIMDVGNPTESSAYMEPKQLSHKAPRIKKDVKVSLNILKIFEPPTKNKNLPTDICSHESNNVVGSNKSVLQEDSSVDESIHRNNAAEATYTIIKESSGMTATDEDVRTSQIIFSSADISDHSGLEKKYPVDGLENIERNDSNLEILNLSSLHQSKLRSSDINSSDYPFHSALFNNYILLSSENFSTSTPEAPKNYNTENWNENNNNSMETSANDVNGNANKKYFNLKNSCAEDDSGKFNENNNNLLETSGNDVDGNSNEKYFDSKNSSATEDSGRLNENNNNLMGTSANDVNENSNGHLNESNTNFMDQKSKLSIEAHGLSKESEMNAEEFNDTDHDDPEYEPVEKSSCDSESDAESDDDRIGSDGQNENASGNDHNITDELNVSVQPLLPGSSRCNHDELRVEKSRGRSGDKKYNFCFYCHKKQLKIARHLELKHSEEEEVKKFIDLPKNSTERRGIIGVIRKRGNFLSNTQTLYNDAELIVSRRPQDTHNRSAGDFKVCANCKAYFSVQSLRMHFAKCTGRSSKKSRMVIVMSKTVEAQVHPVASSDVLKHIMPRFREDETVRAFRYDELVIIYANKMCEKYHTERDYTMVRQRMRLLGRFLLTIRSLNKEVTDLTSVYDPKFCDDTMKAIATEAKVTPSVKDKMTPAVASSLGSLMKLCGTILINECIKKHDDVKKKYTKDFLKLLTQELSISINRRVSEFQTQLQRRKKIELPLMEDVKKLCKFLQEMRDKAYRELKQKFSVGTWMSSAEATLTSLQVFNRRRAGEIERTEIEDFKSHESLNKITEKDLFNSLSRKNQAVAKKYVRFSIRGKKNRPVAVLLSNDLFRCIELLLSHRKDMKISAKNRYVFGVLGQILSSYKHLDACALMRKFSIQCGATFPERLRGTKLRKHIATMCVTMNLTENEVTDLADYMGHAEKIHKNIYRQPVVSREILQMSKLLEAAQGAHGDDDDDADTSEYEGEFEPDIQ